MPNSVTLFRHPAKYVPLSALAIGEANAQAIPVSVNNPFPCSEQPLSSIRALLPDTQVTAGTAVLVDCSASGKIVLEFSDGSQLPLTFSEGVTLLPLAIQNILSGGTTATFSAWVLD